MINPLTTTTRNIITMTHENHEKKKIGGVAALVGYPYPLF